MEQTESLGIGGTIGNKPFSEKPFQTFFSKWCGSNDSISPEYIAPQQRQERSLRGKGFLEKNENNSSTLFVPSDLHLWEMVKLIESVDRDTFVNKPELRELKKQEILELGKMFRNSGIYIAQRMDAIKEGKVIAEELVKNFFSYGNALITGDMNQESKEVKIKNIAKGVLSGEEIEKIDRWLAGEEIYEAGLSKINQKKSKIITNVF